MASLTELPTLLNAIHHRDFNVEKGREMLSSSLVWRKKHGVDKILSEYQVGRDARPLVGSHSAWAVHRAGWPIADSSLVCLLVPSALAGGAPNPRLTARTPSSLALLNICGMTQNIGLTD